VVLDRSVTLRGEQADPKGRPVLSPTTGGAAVRVESDAVTIEGLDISGENSRKPMVGVDADAAGGVTVRGVTVDGCRDGVRVRGGATISNCVIRQGTGIGVRLRE
jgi:nitrous oxidase accessory protein NosD